MLPVAAQQDYVKKASNTDSWQSVQQKKSGRIAVLWYDIEPFIYRRGDSIIGVEYELMQGFAPYLKKKYGVDVTIDWVDARSFENIYPVVKSSTEKGLFGMSFYSITDERKKEVKFSPPYMPDLNIVVSSTNLPVYEKDEEFIKDLKKMHGFTMAQTTMEEDMNKLRNYYPQLNISDKTDDYEVLDHIAAYNNAFGYVPISIYVVALQRGIKVKRQKVLATRREGFAAIYTKASDWDEPINDYFNSPECKTLTQNLIRKHLGEEVANIILDVSAPDSTRNTSSDIELLTKEREIVTQRLIDTALQIQQERILRNVIIGAGILFLIIIIVLYNRFAAKRKFAVVLRQRNEEIMRQKKEIEIINRRLQQKLALSQLNPHLIFNALTAIQYFVMLDDKKMANQYLAQVSKFIRQILQNAEEPLVTLENEKNMIAQYLNLEQVRFNNKFDYSININPNDGGESIPAMLVFPFVEQALYDRVLKKGIGNEKAFLNITFNRNNNTSVIKIADNTAVPLNGESTVSKAAGLAEEQISILNNGQQEKITVVKTSGKEVHGNEITITIPDTILL